MRMLQNFDFWTGLIAAAAIIGAVWLSPLARTLLLTLVAGLFAWSYVADNGVLGILAFAKAAKANAMRAPLFLQGALAGAMLIAAILLAFSRRRSS